MEILRGLCNTTAALPEPNSSKQVDAKPPKHALFLSHLKRVLALCSCRKQRQSPTLFYNALDGIGLL